MLIGSFLYCSEIWIKIDYSFFRFVNDPLKENNFLCNLWAVANLRLADWLEDLCILGFYLAAIFQTDKEKRLRRCAEFFFCVLLTALTIIVVNRLICRDLLHLKRTSPSLALDNVVDLSTSISWVKTKAHSKKSLPGDHATTALMFAISYAYLVRGRLAILALIYGALLCLPRLAVGAHWLSDIVVGSGCIVIFAITWAFFTPFADKVIGALERGLKKFKPVRIKA